MSTKTNQMMAMIAERPGIRSVEIAEAMNMDASSVSGLLRRYVENGTLTSTLVPVPGARSVISYEMASGGTATGTDPLVPRQLWSKVATTAEEAGPTSTGPFSVSLASDGRLGLTLGRKHMDLAADQTRQLVRYLDGINVERILGPI